MQIESAEDLIQALRASGLFTAEQFAGIVRDIPVQGVEPSAMMKQLVRRNRVTLYQLKKILHGKVADLRVGPYIVSDKLGEGGMGKVFHARLAGEGPTVALKVVRAALVANPTVRGRYAREVQATGKLDHPNIVRILDSGEVDGKFYLAMEFVDGIDLARMMRDYGMLEIAEACEYVRQASLGLQHAHEKGFVHRDIKPSNIVVAGERHTPQATEPAVVKILDLGLARAIDPDDMVAPDLTRDHTVVGTPDYMAPEQAKNSKQVDARADLYSLGCTMYFLLTGRVPFQGTNAIQKILAHLNDHPPPLQALRPEVPTAVAEIVVRLMAKRPDDRFPSAAEVAAALEPHARYPDDALPVEITPVRTRKSSHEPSASMSQSSFPSSLGSSIGSISPLGFSIEELPKAQPKPQVQPVAPSDHTPRPAGLPAASSTPLASATPAPPAEKTPQKPLPRKPRRPNRKPAARKPRWLLWLAITVLWLAILVLAIWFVTDLL